MVTRWANDAVLWSEAPSGCPEQSQLIELMVSSGDVGDVSDQRGFDFDLPAGATIIGDAAYNLYCLKDVMAEAGLHLLPVRKKNSKRPHEPWERGLQAICRQQVETADSLLERLLPKSIHATNAQGFKLKVVLFVLASSVERMLA